MCWGFNRPAILQAMIASFDEECLIVLALDQLVLGRTLSLGSKTLCRYGSTSHQTFSCVEIPFSPLVLFHNEDSNEHWIFPTSAHNPRILFAFEKPFLTSQNDNKGLSPLYHTPYNFSTHKILASIAFTFVTLKRQVPCASDRCHNVSYTSSNTTKIRICINL